MKYIHVGCLQQWLQSKIVQKEDGGSYFIQWKGLNCELCKSKFPRKIIADGKQYSLIKLGHCKGNAIYIEQLSDETNDVLGVYVLDFTEKTKLKIGRSLDSDLRSTDISISRFHASIIQTNYDRFYLTDEKSKFGTLVLLTEQFPLSQ
eukprot:TRINITY_DN12110_c0_g1_i3.p3 TRINITY_DN12110_c0_g1~~TRINITY_DN12110_c0_g1_i3.p3  ORF type:complete len:148 (-),score=13.78 TRINITY_DN12110_c0_g1_i3:680-1123(-)